MKEMIAKLKDPKQAQQFCLRTKEEQGVLHEAEAKNLLCLGFPSETWNAAPNSKLSRGVSYILVPGFQPEPEYKHIALEDDGEDRIRLSEEWNGTRIVLGMIPDRPAFAGFFVDAGTPGERPCHLEDVATKIDEGHKVVARFRKE